MAGFYQQKLSQEAQAHSSNLDSAVIFTNVSPVDDTCFNDDFLDLSQFNPCQRDNLTKNTIRWLQLPCIKIITF